MEWIDKDDFGLFNYMADYLSGESHTTKEDSISKLRIRGDIWKYFKIPFYDRRIIRIENIIEKSAYIKDVITKKIYPIYRSEFKEENIIYYRIVLVDTNLVI